MLNYSKISKDIYYLSVDCTGPTPRLPKAVGYPSLFIFIRVAVTNNTPSTELVTIGKLVTPSDDLHHCLPDLRSFDRSAD